MDENNYNQGQYPTPYETEEPPKKSVKPLLSMIFALKTLVSMKL